jgi:acyl-CoA synthetase (AMP-forming)/AMP-acid ligase II
MANRSRTLRWTASALPPSLQTGLVGPGAPFEMRDEPVLGVPCATFLRRRPNVREALLHSATEQGGLDYLVGPETRLSFADTAASAARVARHLRDELGVQQGDRVAIAAANSLAYAVTWWAVVSAGAVAVGLNGWWAAPELAYGIDITAPKVVLGDATRLARLADVAVRPGMPLVDLDALVAEVDRASGETPALPEVPIGEDDPLTVLFTSGTTGRPKGAVLSHRNACHVALAVGLGAALAALGAGSPARADGGQPTSLLTSPLFHVSGTLPLVLGAFFGSKLVLPAPGAWGETRHLELTEEHGVTSWSGVPTQLWRLLQHPQLDRYDLSALRAFGGGGAMFPPELRRLAATRLPAVHLGTGYGMSETFGSGTRLSGSVAEEHPGSVGVVEPGNEIRVIGPDGDVLGEGDVGEVCIRGASVFLGYWDDPAATAAALGEDRWYRTGDFGRIVGDVLYLESRMRDLIIRGGENVYPIEIENRLVAHPDVDDACVVGVDHLVLGQEVAAAIVPRPGATVTSDAVRAWVAEALAPFKVPTHVVTRPSLPYTATGKLLKHEVQAQIQAEVRAELAP